MNLQETLASLKSKTAADANKPDGKSSQRKLACIYIFFNIRIRNMTDCINNHENCEFWTGIGEYVTVIKTQTTCG